MDIRPAEISDVIKRQISEYGREVEVRETGRVLSTGDGIARIHGLDKAAAGELLEFPHNIFGLVLNLEEDNVGAAVFGEAHAIREGDEVRRTNRIAVRSAGALDSKQEADLVAAFRKLTGKDIIPSVVVDADLLGGVVVEVEGKVYDGSVRTQLDRLAKELSGAAAL